jgi:hypothetical protein
MDLYLYRNVIIGELKKIVQHFYNLQQRF